MQGDLHRKPQITNITLKNIFQHVHPTPTVWMHIKTVKPLLVVKSLIQTPLYQNSSLIQKRPKFIIYRVFSIYHKNPVGMAMERLFWFAQPVNFWNKWNVFRGSTKFQTGISEWKMHVPFIFFYYFQTFQLVFVPVEMSMEWNTHIPWKFPFRFWCVPFTATFDQPVFLTKCLTTLNSTSLIRTSL